MNVQITNKNSSNPRDQAYVLAVLKRGDADSQ